MKTIFVNLFGGPGISKSTTAAGVFSLLKMNDVDCEFIPEFAKELCWEERNNSIKDQTYVFGKQYHRNWRLEGKVAVAITDSPIILSIFYDQTKDEDFKRLILKRFNKQQNMNYVLTRTKKYNPNGRWQTAEDADQIDREIEEMLNENHINFDRVNGDFRAVNKITNDIMSELNMIDWTYHRGLPKYQITKFV